MSIVRVSRKKKALIAVAAVLVTCLVWYILADRETQILSDELRKQFGGDYVSLQCGVTHYEQRGDKNAPMVVMIHGSTVSIWDFDLQVQPLLDAGFQTLRYDALGRGLSDRPDTAYTRELYVEQLSQLLRALSVQTPVILLGHSLGGAVAMAFAEQYPNRVKAIALLSPVIDSVHSIPPFFVCNTPVVGDFLLRVAMMEVLRGRADGQWEGVGVDVAAYDALFRRQASIKGFEHAVCSMFQTNLVGDYESTFRAVGRLGIPGLLVYGDQDPVIWVSDVEKVRPFLPTFSFKMISGGRHSAHVQHQKEFDAALLHFLKSSIPPKTP